MRGLWLPRARARLSALVGWHPHAASRAASFGAASSGCAPGCMHRLGHVAEPRGTIGRSRPLATPHTSAPVHVTSEPSRPSSLPGRPGLPAARPRHLHAPPAGAAASEGPLRPRRRQQQRRRAGGGRARRQERRRRGSGGFGWRRGRRRRRGRAAAARVGGVPACPRQDLHRF